MTIPKLTLIDRLVIQRILDIYFGLSNPSMIFDQISDIEYTGNPAGYFSEFGYKDRDFRRENFWTRDQNKVRRFSSILTINDISEAEGIYGMHITFYENRPFGTELFSMGKEIPEEIENASILSLTEI